MSDDLEICYRDTASLVPYSKNSRTHSPSQVAEIASSIEEFGFTNPVLIDGTTNTIIAGHGRLLAAQKLGMKRVPAILLHGLTETQRKALVIADNRIALNAGWDKALLGLELIDLKNEGFDLGLLGFTEPELNLLTKQDAEGLTDPDEVPALPDEPVSRPGDVWLLGNHRLRCGDSTSADDVAALLGPVKPHLMVTDPPYGVSYDPAWRNEADGGSRKRTGKVENDDRADWQEAFALFPGDIAYVWQGDKQLVETAANLEACGFEVIHLIVWAKQRHTLNRAGHYHSQHETCWYAARKGSQRSWSGNKTQTTLWPIDGKNQDTDTKHGTQKPVECMKRPIENNSSPGQAVYDPFLGSGTTLIAAEMTGRHCFGMELSPAYCDVIVCRWQAFTGKVALLESDGRTFAEYLGERTPFKSIGMKSKGDKQ